MAGAKKARRQLRASKQSSKKAKPHGWQPEQHHFKPPARAASATTRQFQPVRG